jgi:hypothetical protein
MQVYARPILHPCCRVAIIGTREGVILVSLPYGRVRESTGRWPVPNRLFEPDQAVQVVASRMDHVQLADELGFDWIGCAQHHYSPGNLASNVSAVAITQRAE